MKTLILAGLAMALLGAGSARAATAARPKKLAVTDVRASGAVDPKTVEALSALIATEASKLPLKVSAGADLSTLMGLEQKKALLGCTDNSCMAELAGALGVDYVLTTEIGKVGDVYLLNMSLLESSKASALKRMSKQVGRINDLIPASKASTLEVLSAIPGLRREAESELESEPQEAVEQEAVSSGSGTHTAGIVLDVAGAALIAGGAACGVLSLLQHDKLDTATGSALEDARSTGKTEALVADILYGVGAAALVTGVVLTILGSGSSSGSGAEESTSVTFAPVSSGGAVVFSGRF